MANQHFIVIVRFRDNSASTAQMVHGGILTLANSAGPKRSFTLDADMV